MPAHRLVLLLPLVLLLHLVPAFAGEKGNEPKWTARVKAFRRALKSRDPKARARTFALLRGAKEPAAVDEITTGIKAVEAAEGKIKKAMQDTEDGYEKSFQKLEEAKQTFLSGGNDARTMKRYNKLANKIAKALDHDVARLKILQNDLTRNRALLQQAVVVMGEILDDLAGEALDDALARLSTAWLQAKGERWRTRWVDAVTEVNKPRVTRRLRGVVEAPGMSDTLRVAALEALVLRDDGSVLGTSFAWLKLPLEKTALTRGAIAALRLMHDRRGIPPLIGFLSREDLKLERNRAHLALVSLTGVDHGPYADQWKKWWEDNQATFQMPKDPKPTGDVAPPRKGTTFYGIQTFSDRILFIVDISGSMDRVQKGAGGGGKTKMAICKQELIGAVYNLNRTDTFNVIFFNHQVIPWQDKKIQATNRDKNLLRKWVTEQQPLGGTNIYDALELGFKIAHRVTGPPNLDTIFFLTDGNPTAGKIRDAKTILEMCREWNKTAKLTIHCIGIGAKHDADFLKELARIGDGKYVRR